MNRRRFLTAIAAAIVATPLAPLVPKQIRTWTSAPIDMSIPPVVKVPVQYLYLTTPFPSMLSEETFLKMYDIPPLESFRMKIDWPLTVKFDKDTMARITREMMLKDSIP